MRIGTVGTRIFPIDRVLGGGLPPAGKGRGPFAIPIVSAWEFGFGVVS